MALRSATNQRIKELLLNAGLKRSAPRHSVALPKTCSIHRTRSSLLHQGVAAAP